MESKGRPGGAVCKEEILAFTLVAFCLAVTGFISGYGYARQKMERNAIEAGVGQYYLTETNERDFRWKESD